MTTETQTSTTPQPEKQSIGQKVEQLQAEKTRITGTLNDMPEGDDKAKAQERIAEIDRKLRWYAGRSGEGKAKAKTERPTRAKSSAKSAKASESPAEQNQPVASAANES